jgi:hypothetical protein
MNKTLWISSLLIAIVLFLFYWNQDTGYNQNQTNYLTVLPYVILYYSTKKQFKVKLKHNPFYEVTFSEAFKIGFQICYTSAMMATVFYFIMPTNPEAHYTSSKLLRTLDVFVGPMLIGTIVSLTSAFILTRIKINPEDANVSKRWIVIYVVIIVSIIVIVLLLLFLQSKK